jgi:hypothetical protein
METRIFTVMLCSAAALLATGCPMVEVTEVGLVPGSAGPGKLTLAATVEAEYEREMCEPEPGEPVDEECEPGPEAYYGHGLIGVWLPGGWQVDKARLVAPGDEPAELEPMSYLAPAFPDTFPHVPGKWWPFLTDCKKIDDGVDSYGFEFDIVGPADAQELAVGVTASGVDDDEVRNPNQKLGGQWLQVQAVVDLAAGTLEQRKPSQREVAFDPAESKKLAECEHVFEEPMQVDRGPRGCSCGVAGVAPGAHLLLLRTLLDII